eukprot:16038834-Heterocapsa_arctica.AAC.1
MSAQGLRLLPGPVAQDPGSSSSWLESVESKSTPVPADHALLASVIRLRSAASLAIAASRSRLSSSSIIP